ncbi:MAG TPA: biotin/lipoyl-containing protein, partial [Thermomicrobiales bacterium]|nr:biotin/lipoyl-containing protein [Thermomicrobiales bacterium]
SRRAGGASLDLKIAAAGLRLRVRWDVAAPAGPAAAPGEGAATGESGKPVEAAIENDEEIIAAPVLGIFYRRSEPGAPPLADVGQIVRAGQPIAVLEVMKTYHEVAAPRDGTLTAFVVEDGAFVEYGQPLARLATRAEGGRERAERSERRE